MVVIFTYTREQAIEDGVLIDVTDMAREAGWKYQTAITAAVKASFVDVPAELKGCQDESGRLWDILWMARFPTKWLTPSQNACLYQLHVQNVLDRHELVTLKAHCGPGDDGEPVITIMLPHED